MTDRGLQKYLASRGILTPWHLEGDDAVAYAGAIVIPALAESQRLFRTLDSLALNPPELLSRFLVVVVVNHRVDAEPELKKDNLLTLDRLRRGHPALRLCWVDAANEGVELPAATGGVGLARKIGMDLALPRLTRDGILISLDADTLVDPRYLPCVAAHFRNSSIGGAVIPFRHQSGETAAEERAITRYELFLRYYVLGLEYSGSPYAFHTVGSAMACSARAYVASGGMNSRSAAEDFYFLQQLKKTAGIAPVHGSVVRPAARSSFRVPFGTGKSISRLLADGDGAVTFYHPDCFRVLKDWLTLAKEGSHLRAEEVLLRSREIEPGLTDFLAGTGFAEVWERLRRNHSNSERLVQAFHGWFDGLKTLRLVHHLCGIFPRSGPEATVPELLRLVRVAAPEGDGAQLELLRAMQLIPLAHIN